MSDYLFGSSYYPEWWPEEQWKTDFEKMASLGLNAVRMGEFAWSWYEPTEGEYNFAPMQRAVALAAEYGVSREVSEKDTADFLDVIRSAGFIEE